MKPKTDPRLEIPAELARRYFVDSLLGEGTFGRVLKVRDQELDRWAALKLCKDQLSTAERGRFFQEAKVLADLRLSGVVQLFDYGEIEGVPYLVMEWADGLPLSKVREFPRAPFLLRSARVLQGLHDAGVLHRDIKPDNLMVVGGARPLFLDFGLVLTTEQVRKTATGARVGTLAYMAPEVLRGQGEATQASDWYSWGVTLYEAMEGNTPYLLSDLMVPERPLPAPTFQQLDSRGPLARILRGCLALKHADRLRGLKAIEEILGSEDSTSHVLRSGGTSSQARGRVKEVEASALNGDERIASLRGRLGLALLFVGALLWTLWTLAPVNRPPESTSEDPTAERTIAALARLQQAMEPLRKPHLNENGRLHSVGDGGPVRDHFDGLMDAFADPRFQPRWRRLQRAVLEALPLAIGATSAGRDLESYLWDQTVPLLRHIAADLSIATVSVGVLSVFDRSESAPTDAARAYAVKERLKELRQVGEENLDAFLAIPARPLGVVVETLLLTYKVPDYDQRRFRRIQRAFQAARTPTQRFRMLRAALAVIPSLRVTLGEYSCDFRSRVLEWVDERYWACRETFTPEQDGEVVSNLVYRLVVFCSACSEDLDPWFLRLDAAVEILDQRTEFVPESVDLYLTLSLLVTDLGFMQTAKTNPLDGRISRLNGIRKRVRGW